MLSARYLHLPWLALLFAGCPSPVAPPTSTVPVLDDGDEDCEDPEVYFADLDLDGFGDADTTRELCAPISGWVSDNTDCDDDDSGTFPGAIEACDLVDRDCNGIVDDNALDAPRWHPDEDGDGYGNDSAVRRSCTRPTDHQPAARGTDCDDTDPAIFPGAPDTACDGVDQDCSGEGEFTVAQIGGRTYPEAQLALRDATPDTPVYLCEGEHRVGAEIAHDLELIGLGEVGQVLLRPLGTERILTVTADRLVLTNLAFEDSSGRGDGGAVLATVREIRGTDLAFRRNQALLRGGAMHVELIDAADFEATFSGFIAENNRAGRSGGALSIGMARNGFATVEDAVFIGNRTEQNGGAVWLEGSDNTQVLSINNLVGRDNHAAGRGGSLALAGKRNAILRGRFVDLRGGTARQGGLLSLTAPIDGKIELADCVLHDGTATESGGLVHHAGEFTLDNTLTLCDLSRGTAPIGGLQWLGTGESAHLTWTQVDLHHGDADDGSAIFLTGRASPFSGALDRVLIRDNAGGPAFTIDDDYLRADALKLELEGGGVLRNEGGGISATYAFEVGLDGVDMGTGESDNGGFDVRHDGRAYRWEGGTTATCVSGVCR